MSEPFVPLAAWLRPAPAAEIKAAAADVPVESVEELEFDPAADPFDDVLAETRRFRAALAEALDRGVEALRRDVAIDVLGRELEMRDADIAAIVERARERYGGEFPLRVRVHPQEAARLSDVYCVLPDASLRRGDAVLELRCGEIDATFGARLQRLLDARS
jgi:flagellar biosynthesis/type III secretory pathway protein FliH